MDNQFRKFYSQHKHMYHFNKLKHITLLIIGQKGWDIMGIIQHKDSLNYLYTNFHINHKYPYKFLH